MFVPTIKQCLHFCLYYYYIRLVLIIISKLHHLIVGFVIIVLHSFLIFHPISFEFHPSQYPIAL